MLGATALLPLGLSDDQHDLGFVKGFAFISDVSTIVMLHV